MFIRCLCLIVFPILSLPRPLSLPVTVSVSYLTISRLCLSLPNSFKFSLSHVISFFIPFRTLPLLLFFFRLLSPQVLFNILQWRNFLKTSMVWTMITYLLELLVTLVFMILVGTPVCTYDCTFVCTVDFLFKVYPTFYSYF